MTDERPPALEDSDDELLGAVVTGGVASSSVGGQAAAEPTAEPAAVVTGFAAPDPASRIEGPPAPVDDPWMSAPEILAHDTAVYERVDHAAPAVTAPAYDVSGFDRPSARPPRRCTPTWPCPCRRRVHRPGAPVAFAPPVPRWSEATTGPVTPG